MSTIDAITDAAIEQAYDGADDAWKDAALAAVHAVAARLETFTPDDVWEELGQEPVEKRAMGGVIRRAVAAGYIEKTGVTSLSRLESRQKGYNTVWRSRLHPNYVATVTDAVMLTQEDRDNIKYALKFVLDRYSNQTDNFKTLARRFGVRGI